MRQTGGYDATWCDIEDSDEDKLDKCEEYFQRIRNLEGAVLDELKHYDDHRTPSDIDEEADGDNDDEMFVYRHKKGPRALRLPKKRLKRIQGIRKEIDLLSLQLEIQVLDYEHAYKHLGFHLMDVYKRGPELVYGCDCSPHKRCNLHAGAFSIVTSIYEPMAVRRVGHTFVVFDGVQEILQICSPEGERMTLFKNQIVSLSWFIFPLLSGALMYTLPKRFSIPLGDGYVLKYRGCKRPIAQYSLVDVEGQSVTYTSYDNLEAFHQCCLEFPHLLNSKFESDRRFKPCLFTHCPKDIDKCSVCSINPLIEYA